MIISKTIAIPPHDPDYIKTIILKLLELTGREFGFILRVNSISFKMKNISFSGNYLYTFDADVDNFLPECNQKFEAVVQMNRSKAHVATIFNKMRVIFHSDVTYPVGAKVTCVLKETRFQRGTYRAIAELCEAETSSSAAITGAGAASSAAITGATSSAAITSSTSSNVSSSNSKIDSTRTGATS